MNRKYVLTKLTNLAKLICTLQMSKVILIRNVRVVGMHHHVLTKRLQLGMRYQMMWEPDCIHDPGNAVGIKNAKKQTNAYITREDAAIISRLFCAGVVLNNTMYCKTHVQPHVEYHDLGPQQECNVQFKVDVKDLELATHIIASLSFSVC